MHQTSQHTHKQPTQQRVNLYTQLYQLSTSPQNGSESPSKKAEKPSILTQFILKKLKNRTQQPWSMLERTSELIRQFVQYISHDEGSKLEGGSTLVSLYATPHDKSDLYRIQGAVHFVHPELVYIGKGTVIQHGAMITGPCVIGQNCQLRKGTYIRGNVILGDHSLLGNSCEVKNAILMDHCQIAHFNYIGDSILGIGAHFSAGAITSNYKLDGSEVKIAIKVYPHNRQTQNIDEGSSPTKRVLLTGRNKLGALIGHHSEIGCNAILNPGTIIGRNSVIYPLVNWRGQLGSNQICKLVQQNTIVEKLQRR